ncbi:MAG: ACT domain-containing protein [Actinomycetota bacterium]|nr:ACT domain-containing protein [Actinomycetota bacterium]
MIWNKEAETMPREKLEELQLERLRQTVKRVYENVPMYKKRFDEPGSLARILTVLDDNGMNVEYLYCFVDKNRNAAIDIMRVEDSEKAIEVMQKANLKILSEAELSAL